MSLISKLKTFLHNYNVLIENIFSLGLIQFLNYLFPLITLPYIVRILGVEKFGLVNFVLAFTAYFGLITDYGFNISAVRKIAIIKVEKHLLGSYVSTVYLIKTILFLISFIIFIIAIRYLKIFENETLLLFTSFLYVVGNLLTPYWLYQGLEKMKYVTLVTFVIKVIWTFSIFILIKKESDYILYSFLNSIQFIISGIILFVLVIRVYKIKLSFPSIQDIKEQLIEGGLMFISTISISFYTITNTIILGVFTNNVIVGYFTAADKIRQAIQNMISPFTQATYAHVSNIFGNKSSRKEFQYYKGKRFIINSFKIIGSGTFIISLIIYLFANSIVNIMLGPTFANSIILLKILSFLPFIIYISNLFGIQTMLNLGYEKAFTMILFIGALFNVIVSIVLVPIYGALGTSFAILTTESLITLLIIYYLHKKRFFVEKEI